MTSLNQTFEIDHQHCLDKDDLESDKEVADSFGGHSTKK